MAAEAGERVWRMAVGRGGRRTKTEEGGGKEEEDEGEGEDDKEAEEEEKGGGEGGGARRRNPKERATEGMEYDIMQGQKRNAVGCLVGWRGRKGEI